MLFIPIKDEFALALGTKPKAMVASKFMVKIMGLFNPVMKELNEMLYQYDKDYFFNSEKFENTFDFKTTSYQKGIKAVINFDK